jgi:CHAD domain-containing protein
MRQLELKVELSKSDMQRLGGKLRCEGLASGSPPSTRQRTVYFDTPGYKLHAAGLSLWLSRQDRRWLQIIKADKHVADSLSGTVELESPVACCEPNLAKITDKRIRRAAQKAVVDNALRPVFETVIQRSTRKMKSPISEMELSADYAASRAGRDTRELREAELQLKSGSAEGLLFAVEKLFGDQSLKLTWQGRAADDRRLAHDKSEVSADPEKARPARISTQHTCVEAFSAILASATRQIVVNRQTILLTDDPEGAHQMRIGLRRLRSALRALRPLVDASSLRAFERSAREIGRCVGTLRDADVLILGIQAPMEQVASNKSGFPELRDALVRHQQAKRDEVRSVLGGPQWGKLHLYLTLWPKTLEGRDALDKPISRHACRILRRAWRKAAKLGRKLDQLDDEHRHEMRKALKHVRYQAEFFSPLFKKNATRHFIERLKALQDVFGYVNDVRMAPRLVELQHAQRAGVRAARAASYVVGRHDAEAEHVWHGAGELWKELKHAPLFWT